MRKHYQLSCYFYFQPMKKIQLNESQIRKQYSFGKNRCQKNLTTGEFMEFVYFIILSFLHMSPKIKNHRRNKAVEQTEDYYRFSVPTTGIDIPGQSYSPEYETPVKYRSSDMTNLALHGPLFKKISPKKQNTQKSEQSTKKSAQMQDIMKSIKEKLLLAARQLKPTPIKEMNESNYELKSFKQSCSSSGKWDEPSIIALRDESTLNIQSQKRLTCFLKRGTQVLTINKDKTYYVKELVKALELIRKQDFRYNRAIQHLEMCAQIIEDQQYNKYTAHNQKINYVYLPVHPSNKGKHVLVIDLDETLIHCEDTRKSSDDLEIVTCGRYGKEKNYISVRPYAISFLKKAAKKFEIIAFTASQKDYADSILNIIDPDYEYIHHRLYREHCTKFSESIYVKDLRIIRRDLAKTVIVDNSAYSYLFQIENAIPILPYYSGVDSELLSLEKYFQTILKVEDVRIINQQTFKLTEYKEYKNTEDLIYSLYCQGNYY